MRMRVVGRAGGDTRARRGGVWVCVWGCVALCAARGTDAPAHTWVGCVGVCARRCLPCVRARAYKGRGQCLCGSPGWAGMAAAAWPLSSDDRLSVVARCAANLCALAFSRGQALGQAAAEAAARAAEAKAYAAAEVATRTTTGQRPPEESIRTYARCVCLSLPCACVRVCVC